MTYHYPRSLYQLASILVKHPHPSHPIQVGFQNLPGGLPDALDLIKDSGYVFFNGDNSYVTAQEALAFPEAFIRNYDTGQGIFLLTQERTSL